MFAGVRTHIKTLNLPAKARLEQTVKLIFP
jgi:hypothetical protein